MARLVPFVLVIAIAVLAVMAIVMLWRLAGRAPADRDEDNMPARFRMVAYLLLLALMIGVTAGWLGAV